MRAVLKKSLAVLLASLLLFCLASCNQNQEGADSSDSGAETSAEQEIGDNNAHYDEITKTLKLEKDYDGKSFLNDGIGAATVDAYTDGDTTRFKLSSGETVIVRYYMIDTPESTSNIEKWGKAASNFTKSCLSSATEVVLEATGDRAEHDSYGTRYLGYVWYRTSAEEDFKCLNLELVENGFTENKGINTDDYPYYATFNQANLFAKRMQLHIYSSLEDPLFSDDPQDLILKDFENNPDLYYDSETDSGARVRLTAVLTSLHISTTGTYTYTATEIDPETGESYKINVYAGYSSASASNMKLGHLYEIVGNLQYYGGSFQISGLHYNSVYEITDGDYTYVKQKNYYLTFNDTVEYITQYSHTLYSDVTVVQSSVENGILSIVGTAQQRSKSGYKDDVLTFTFNVPVSDNIEELPEGTKFSVSGYQFEADSGVITVYNYSDLIFK